LRDGKAMTLSVMPQALPQEQFARLNRETAPGKAAGEPASYTSEELGMQVSELTAEQAQAMNLPASGVVITSVEPNKPAFEAKLRPGMAILKVGRTPVKSVEQFQAAMKDQSLKNKILFQVQERPGQTAFYVVK
jgi:serine protease Do